MKNIREDISEAELKVNEKYRGRVDLLCSRLSILSGEDRLLMTMYWENGNTFRQIGRLAGVSRISIARRIHKLTERIMGGQYIACLRNRDKFTKNEMAIAKDYFIQGLSMKKIAAKRQWSSYRVRQTINKIKRLLATMNGD